jgi:outer membrane cobalamin receptor
LTASITGYQMDMTNELDFDSKAYRYVNIGRSQHRGLEAGANVEGPRTSAFVAYTLQAATSKSGSAYGKRLKAVPQHTLNAGLTATPYAFLDAALIASHVRGIYLDDENTVTMPNYTRVDLRVSMRAAGRSLFADVRNVLDARYTTTGFLDPAGSKQAYLFPAAGRIIEIGLRSGF